MLCAECLLVNYVFHLDKHSWVKILCAMMKREEERVINLYSEIKKEHLRLLKTSPLQNRLVHAPWCLFSLSHSFFTFCNFSLSYYSVIYPTHPLISSLGLCFYSLMCLRRIKRLKVLYRTDLPTSNDSQTLSQPLTAHKCPLQVKGTC